MSNPEIFNYTTYSTGIDLLSQQLTERTRASVMVEAASGERKAFDQMGAVRAREKTSRETDITTITTPKAKRWVSPTHYQFADFVDEFDKLTILNDPTNPMSQSFSAALKRQLDYDAVTASIGTAYTGKEGTTATVLPSTQKIAHGSAGFTLSKLQDAVKMLKAKNALMPGERPQVFWTAAQELEFLTENKVQSADYNNRKVLTEGSVLNFYGCDFHLVEDFVDEEGDTINTIPLASSVRSCVMWLRSGMKMGEWRPGYGRVEWIPRKASYQVSAGASWGFTRMEEVKVVQIDVQET